MSPWTPQRLVLAILGVLVSVVGIGILGVVLLAPPVPEWLVPLLRSLVVPNAIVGLVILVGIPTLLVMRRGLLLPIPAFVVYIFSVWYVTGGPGTGDLPGWLLFGLFWPLGVLLYLVAVGIEQEGWNLRTAIPR